MSSTHILDIIGLFLFLAGYVLGLGAVTVIDIHGFLGRTSSYWTEATTRTHKITKPLIWIGITCTIVGGLLFYRSNYTATIPLVQAVIARLRTLGATTVRSLPGVEEHVRFPLPMGLGDKSMAEHAASRS